MTKSSPPVGFEWTKPAKKDLRKLTKTDRRRIERALRRFADQESVDCRRLHGFKRPRYRLRKGDWRVMFKKEDGGFKIMRVLHRREAYRKSAKIRQAVPDASEVVPESMAERMATYCTSVGIAG